jgi:hypothetical protein
MTEVTLPFAGLELVNGTQKIDETRFDFRDWKDSIIEESAKIQDIVKEWSGRYLAPPIISDILIQDTLLIPMSSRVIGEIIFLGEHFIDKDLEYLYYRTLVYNQVSGWRQSYVCAHHTLKNFIIMYK